MQNLENEKLSWEAPRLTINEFIETNSGIDWTYTEGAHTSGTNVAHS